MSTFENTLYGGRVDLGDAKSNHKIFRFSEIEWLPEIGSTNVALAERARAGVGESVLGADFQTAGKGRRERRWEAERGNSLLFSILVDPALEPNDIGLVTIALAVSVCDACEELLSWSPRLKWPNDIIVEDPQDGSIRKLAGILAELVLVDGDARVVVGIGINLDWVGEIPEELAATMSTLRAALGRPVPRSGLLGAILSSFELRLGQAEAEHLRPVLLDEYSRLLATIGKQVRVEMVNSELVGLAVGVTPQGRLEVDCDGVRTVVDVGDVHHCRIEISPK
jgi:BirA family biotin operon repressor/biotin-[acetyl-CoA-carboxylase] ligase